VMREKSPIETVPFMRAISLPMARTRRKVRVPALCAALVARQEIVLEPVDSPLTAGPTIPLGQGRKDSQLEENAMDTKTVSTEQDKKALLAIVEEMSKSTTGAQSTRQWAPEAIWFDVPPFASKGVEPARKQFDKEFGAVSSFVAEILRTEIVVNGD